MYVRVLAASDEQIADALTIPATARVGRTIACTWDAGPYVLEALGRFSEAAGMRAHLLERAQIDAARMPGLARYRALGLHLATQPHQKDDVLMLAAFSGALVCEPPRSGKSFAALAADILVDSRKTLIVCPAVVKNVWADEIFRWVVRPSADLGSHAPSYAPGSVVVLEGRGGRKIRVLDRGGGSSGRILRVPTLRARLYKKPDIRARAAGVVAGARGWHMRWPREYRCDAHPEVAAAVPALCPSCQRALDQAIAGARYVIVNYDVLGVHEDRTAVGKRRLRLDLRGWAGAGLSSWGFDVAIVDEIHLMRGWNTASRNRETRRNVTLLRVLRKVPRVWGLTGTLYYGFTRDAFWPLQLVTGGLWGAERAAGFKYMKRYAAGHKGEFGFVATGRSPLAETELTARLTGFVRQRTRAEIYAHAPGGPAQKVRTVMRMDLEPDERRALEKSILRLARRRGNTKSKWQATIGLLNALKRERMKVRFMDELAFDAKSKLIVFCYHKAGARDTFLALDRLMGDDRFAARMKQVRARLWLATGTVAKGLGSGSGAGSGAGQEDEEGALADESDAQARLRDRWVQSSDARYAMAKAFREHDGAALVVATTDSMPGGLSMLGAQAVYHLDWHTSPGAITQAEDRAYAPDIPPPGLAIVHCSVRNSLDDHLEELVTDKSETCVKLANEQNAQSILHAIAESGAMSESVVEARMADVWAQMTAHLSLDSGDED